MSDFLINLALRAAGVLRVASPEIPLAPWSEPPDPGLGLTELVQEEVAPRSPPPASHEGGTLPARPPLPVPERADVSAQPPIPGGQQKAHAPLRPAPPAPERIREVRTEHHEVVREAAPVPPIEVHETIREKEIVRERLVEREVNAEAPPPRPRIVAIPAAVPTTPRSLDVEPGSNEVVREVVLKAPVPMPQPTLSPAPPAEIVPTPRRTERVTELKPEELPGAFGKTLPRQRESPTPLAQVSPRPAVTVAKTASAEVHVPTKTASAKPLTPTEQTFVVTPREPVLRPALLPDAPWGPSADRTKAPAREKAVEVKIGSIEIRTAAPSPQPRTPEPASSSEPLEGFEAYRSVRRYSAWSRE